VKLIVLNFLLSALLNLFFSKGTTPTAATKEEKTGERSRLSRRRSKQSRNNSKKKNQTHLKVFKNRIRKLDVNNM
jgi:hypothetical protein